MENIERIEAKKHIIANLDREEGSAGVTTHHIQEVPLFGTIFEFPHK